MAGTFERPSVSLHASSTDRQLVSSTDRQLVNSAATYVHSIQSTAFNRIQSITAPYLSLVSHLDFPCIAYLLFLPVASTEYFCFSALSRLSYSGIVVSDLTMVFYECMMTAKNTARKCDESAALSIFLLLCPSCLSLLTILIYFVHLIQLSSC